MDELSGIQTARLAGGGASLAVPRQPARGITDWLPQDVPAPVSLLFAISLVLIAAPVMDFWLGSPGRLRDFLSLNAENTVQAWYSSMQWLCAGAAFGLGTLQAYRNKLPGSVAIGLFALACLAFSLDEIAGIHEWLGQKSDALLPAGGRRNTLLLSRTGLWPFLIGIPVLAALTIIVRGMRQILLRTSPRGWRLLVIGLVVMFTGALALELCANFFERVPEDPGLNLVQQVAEEFMEMLGATFVAWSGFELLRSQGVRLKAPA